MGQSKVSSFTRFGFTLGAGFAFGAISLGQGSPIVGKLTAARNAELSTGPVAGTARYANAEVGMGVREGFGIRTRRRSFAEVTFKDGSAIRVNEQTDIVIMSATTLRRVRLEKGQAWVKDKGGSRTSVQTPVGTATARGTEFIVSADGKVEVKEGEVELVAAGVSLLLGPGETGGIGPGGGPEKLGGGQPNAPGETGGEEGQNWYDKAQQMPAPSLIGGGLIGGLAATQLGERSGGQDTAVPEPATIVALAIGGFALLRRRRAR